MKLQFLLSICEDDPKTAKETVRSHQNKNGTESVNQTLREYNEKSWHRLMKPHCHALHSKTCSYYTTKPPDLSYLYVFGALCYPTNDSENLGKLQPKADIGIFIGYAPTKKAFQIYNRRTRRIIETIHVDFDELTAMASEHSSSGPALHDMTPARLVASSAVIEQDEGIDFEESFIAAHQHPVATIEAITNFSRSFAGSHEHESIYQMNVKLRMPELVFLRKSLYDFSKAPMTPLCSIDSVREKSRNFYWYKYMSMTLALLQLLLNLCDLISLKSCVSKFKMSMIENGLFGILRPSGYSMGLLVSEGSSIALIQHLQMPNHAGYEQDNTLPLDEITLYLNLALDSIKFQCTVVITKALSSLCCKSRQHSRIQAYNIQISLHKE
ncbi:retrovirus-related pol polyprotein from transposon TNT 1-94 [Tanacetum coccineum]